MSTKFFDRYITNKLSKRFAGNRIIILIGSRQVGKTNIVKNFTTNLLKKGKFFYFNFEKTADLESWQNLDYLERYLSQNRVTLKDKLFIAIDEFQYLKNAGKILKLIYDEYPNVKILATGSSSIEIQKHLKESLAGRKKVYNVYTLSFEEFMLAIGEKKKWNQISTENILPAQANKFNIYLADYMLWGGYPRLAEKYKSKPDEKKEELFDIYNSYVQKDIKALIGGENILGFNNLVKILAAQIGNLLNINELSATLNLPRYEIEKYLSILEETFIIKRLPAFFSNKRKEITKMPKIYFSDLGLSNMAIANFSKIEDRPNLGALIENYTFCQLRYFLEPGDEIYFWRTLEGAEVDFVLKRNDALIPIEVKWVSGRISVPRGLKSFAEKFKKVKEAWIITKDYAGVEKIGKVKFIFIPAAVLIKKR